MNKEEYIDEIKVGDTVYQIQMSRDPVTDSEYRLECTPWKAVERSDNKWDWINEGVYVVITLAQAQGAKYVRDNIIQNCVVQDNYYPDPLEAYVWTKDKELGEKKLLEDIKTRFEKDSAEARAVLAWIDKRETQEAVSGDRGVIGPSGLRPKMTRAERKEKMMTVMREQFYIPRPDLGEHMSQRFPDEILEKWADALIDAGIGANDEK